MTLFTKSNSPLSKSMFQTLNSSRVAENGKYKYTIDKSDVGPTSEQLDYMKTFIHGGEFRAPCCVDWDHRKSAQTMEELKTLLHRFH